MTQPPEIDARLTQPLKETFKTVEKVVRDPELQKLPHEFIERLWTIAIAAIGLIAAFAWDRFLRELIDLIFSKNESLWILFAYALLMTLLAAAVALQIPRIERWYTRSIRKQSPGGVRKNREPRIPIGERLKD
ncbi:hypothetical protein H6776_01935 [Candidatus Nomurabacteria bacterium]|nr:hypothetical protein [Candidatus Nomurabacteria bacterium]